MKLANRFVMFALVLSAGLVVGCDNGATPSTPPANPTSNAPSTTTGDAPKSDTPAPPPPASGSNTGGGTAVPK